MGTRNGPLEPEEEISMEPQTGQENLEYGPRGKDTTKERHKEGSGDHDS